MVFVNASSAKSVAINPLATAAPPADTAKPFKFRPVTLYVAAAKDEVVEPKLTPTATPEQITGV